MNPSLDGDLALPRVEEVLDERLPLRDHGVLHLLRRVLWKVLKCKHNSKRVTYSLLYVIQ